MREGISSVDKDCKLLLLPGNRETKEKKKKKEKSKQTSGSKKRGHSSTPQNSDDTEKPHPAHDATPPLPRPPRGSGGVQLAKVKGRERRGGESGNKRSKKPKDASLTDELRSSGGGAPSQGAAAALSAQARESLRWEGVLEDPQAEERRMEVYRANRRQRYLVHRQALLASAKLPVLDQ